MENSVTNRNEYAGVYSAMLTTEGKLGSENEETFVFEVCEQRPKSFFRIWVFE